MASVVFGDRSLEVVLVPNPNASEAPTISASDIQSTLREVGWTDIEDAQYHTLVDDLRRNLNTLNATQSSPFSSGASVRQRRSLLDCHNTDTMLITSRPRSSSRRTNLRKSAPICPP